MKNRIYFVLALLITLSLFTGTALAQDEGGLILKMSRDWGYSSGGGQIQGTFSVKAEGPDNLQRVVFLIDDQTMAEITQAPFRYQFQTESYPLGVHTLRAVGYTTDGQELNSNVKKLEFVSASEGTGTALKILIPVLGLILGAMLISFGATMFLSRGKKGAVPLGAPRNYGLTGGTICPKCQRPFGMHIFGLNLVVGKLDFCPHCGKWSVVRRYSAEQLRQAELAEQEWEKESAPASPTGEQKDLRKELEDSRYMDK